MRIIKKQSRIIDKVVDTVKTVTVAAKSNVVNALDLQDKELQSKRKVECLICDSYKTNRLRVNYCKECGCPIDGLTSYKGDTDSNGKSYRVRKVGGENVKEFICKKEKW